MYFEVTDVRNAFRNMKRYSEFNARGMLEMQGVSFIASEPFIFGTVNEEYIAMEIAWYESQSLNVYDMKKPPKVWMDVATSYGNINSNYGYLTMSKENGEQFRNVVRTLRKRPDSKQATMIYTRPTMHQEAYIDGMKDFVCTNSVNYNQDIQDTSKINAIVQMRSNDAIFGYKNDYAWQKYMLEKVCAEVDKTPGDIIWQTASLHIYPRHLDLII